MKEGGVTQPGGGKRTSLCSRKSKQNKNHFACPTANIMYKANDSKKLQLFYILRYSVFLFFRIRDVKLRKIKIRSILFEAILLTFCRQDF